MVKERSVRLTAAGKARLEGELADLLGRRRPDLIARVKEASEHGRADDVGEYEELKEALVFAEARIKDLEQTLLRAELIRRDAGDDAAGLGSRVALRGDDGEEESWVLVGPEEARGSAGRISTESPVGRALLGCRPGDSPTVTTPGGTAVYTVLSVTHEA